MMKKKFLIVSLLLLCSIFFTACGDSQPHEMYFVEKFGVTLPDNINFNDITRLYTVNTQGGFHGDGEHYAAFKLNEQASEFLTDFNKPHDLEAFEKHWLICNLNDLEIPVEFKPDWEKEFFWKRFDPLNGGSDRLYLIYQPHSLQLFFFVWLI